METDPSLVAVLFTDLVGSTALRAALGEERADELRKVHDRLLTRRVEAHGGRVVRGKGDGVMATFPSASAALSASVEMQQALDRYGHRPDAIARLSVRMGLSVGDVSWDAGDCFGLPLVEAARLEAMAEGGQILATEFVALMARGRRDHQFKDLGFLDLKGLPQPVAACEVLWEPAPAPEPVVLPPDLAVPARRPFVSRTSELVLAETVLADPARDRAAVLWVLGEPGIGKTRFASEAARRAHAGGVLVLFGRCHEDLSVPYQPFAEALRFFAAHVPDDELEERLGTAPAELTRLVPELAPRLPGLEASQSTSPEVEQYRLFEAVRSWLAEAASGRPVVVVVDDVHWATPPTISLLGFVARSCEPSKVVLVCTARDTSPDASEDLAALVDELARRGTHSHRLQLAGLVVDEVADLLSSTGRPEGDVYQLAVRLQAETAGNPLFLDALLSSLDQAGASDELPHSVAETVRRRVARLPEDVQELLRVASVIGVDFDLRVAARAADHGELDALDRLDLGARAGLVAATDANRHRFTHGLVRSALREDISPPRRVRVHLRVGEAIESLFDGRLDEHASELAYHFSEAVPVGGAGRAYRYAVRAADEAVRLLAHREAADAYGRALALLDEVEGVEPLARCELLLARGEALRRAGDFASALTSLHSAAQEAAARGAADHLARATIAFERASFQPGMLGAEVVDLLERAAAALPSHDSALRALTLAALCRALEFSGRRGDGVQMRHSAEAMAVRLGDVATIAQVRLRTDMAFTGVEEAPRMLTRWRELTAMARELGDDDLHEWAVSLAVVAAAQVPDPAAYDELVAEWDSAVEQVRQPQAEHVRTMLRYNRAVLAGDLTVAETLLEHALEVGQAIGVGGEGTWALNKFFLLREQGRLASLAPALRALVRLNPDVALWRPGLAALYVETGMLEEAREEFEVLAASGFASDDDTRQLCLGLLAEVCAALGDSERASWLFEELRPCEERMLFFLGTWACLGPTDRLLGMLAATAGRPDDAQPFFERATQLSRRIASPLWTAHCLYDHAIRFANGASRHSMLAEATELCHRHGLRGLGARLAGSLP